MNNENEIKHRLLDICKVKSWDSDINILGFHVLCDKLKQLGADEEREECAKLCDALAVHPEYASEVTKLAALAIRARGNT